MSLKVMCAGCSAEERERAESDVRRALGARYHALLAPLQGAGLGLLAVRPDRDCVWGQYTVLLDERERVRQALHEAGIPSAVHYPRALLHQPMKLVCRYPSVYGRLFVCGVGNRFDLTWD